jgi:hypothetical protein
MKLKMKRGRTPENIRDLEMLLDAFGPTRNCLTAATKAYLAKHPNRKQKKQAAPTFDTIPAVQ